MFIDRFNDNKIRVAPCCQAESAIESIDLFDFKTSPYLSSLRTQFDQGQKPTACSRCWQAEDMGHKSRRQSAIEFFNSAELDTEIRLEGLDHSATWACNMACIMCGPEYSSLWAREKSYTSTDLRTIGRSFQKDNDILSKLDVSNIKKIHFNGGEPLLNLHQIELLKQLDEQDVLKKVFISYNTNGSIFPDSRILKYWEKSQLVKLFFSIDATGLAFEYIRWPGNWNRITENIKRMRDTLPSNVMFGINVTVGNYNILELSSLWNWFETTIATNKEGDPSDFNWQIANNFDPGNCNQQVKFCAIEDLKNIKPLSGVVNYIKMSMNQTISDSWIDVFNEYDLKRNTDWRTSLKIAEYY
jgi:sulfatase maturation enzyme AslB (radical SAM superfamily)